MLRLLGDTHNRVVSAQSAVQGTGGAGGNSLVETTTRGVYFDAAASKNVTALLGKTAFLNCRVKNLANRTVSVILLRHKAREIVVTFQQNSNTKKYNNCPFQTNGTLPYITALGGTLLKTVIRICQSPRKQKGTRTINMGGQRSKRSCWQRANKREKLFMLAFTNMRSTHYWIAKDHFNFNADTEEI